MFYNGWTCCPNQTSYYCPVCNYQNRNNYAIVLVLLLFFLIIIYNSVFN